MVNDDVNSYLAEAGVRLQPRGYKWHVLVPESVRDGEELEYALREKNQYIEPAEVLRAIERSYESTGQPDTADFLTSLAGLRSQPDQICCTIIHSHSRTG